MLARAKAHQKKKAVADGCIGELRNCECSSSAHCVCRFVAIQAMLTRADVDGVIQHISIRNYVKICFWFLNFVPPHHNGDFFVCVMIHLIMLKVCSFSIWYLLMEGSNLGST